MQTDHHKYSCSITNLPKFVKIGKLTRHYFDILYLCNAIILNCNAKCICINNILFKQEAFQNLNQEIAIYNSYSPYQEVDTTLQ